MAFHILLRRHASYLAFGLSPFCLTGCIAVRSFPTIEPKTFEPSRASPMAAIVVDSLTPTFKWEQPNPEKTAEFVIWAVGFYGYPGDVVYHAENIFGSRHTPTTQLQPGTDYFWSVRETGSQEWASMKYTRLIVIPTPVVAVGSWSKRDRIPFKIHTPGLPPPPRAPVAPASKTDP